MLKQSNITEIEHLNFNNLDPDDLKEVVNLDYLNWKLKSLRYNSQDWDLLNDQVYENISLINLQKLYLSGLSSISNSLRVLSNLPYDTTIDLASSSPEFFNLKFTKLELLFQSKQSLFRLSWKEVIFKFNDDLEQEDIVLLGGNIICISLFKGKIQIECSFNMEKWREGMGKTRSVNPIRGHIHYLNSTRIFWRCVRGMAQHKAYQLAVTLGRLKTFERIPSLACEFS